MSLTLSHFVDVDALDNDGWRELEPAPVEPGDPPGFEQRNWERGDVLITVGTSIVEPGLQGLFFAVATRHGETQPPIHVTDAYVRPEYRQALMSAPKTATNEATVARVIVVPVGSA